MPASAAVSSQFRSYSVTHLISSFLIKEVTEKSERIAQLEQEKSALIKQLFEARARSAQDTSVMDSTFIWEQLHSTIIIAPCFRHRSSRRWCGAQLFFFF